MSNFDYDEIGIEPFEVFVRYKIGKVIPIDNFDDHLDFSDNHRHNPLGKHFFYGASISRVNAVKKILGELDA